MVLVKLPVRREDGGYRCRRLNVHLGPEQAEALRMLYDGIGDMRLKDGSRVKTANDTIRFVLERVYDMAGA